MPVVVVVEEDEEAIEAAVVGVAVGMEVVEIGTMTVCRLSISCLLCHHYKHCLSDQGLDLDDFHVKGLCISKIHLTNYIIKLGVPQAITNVFFAKNETICFAVQAYKYFLPATPCSVCPSQRGHLNHERQGFISLYLYFFHLFSYFFRTSQSEPRVKATAETFFSVFSALFSKWHRDFAQWRRHFSNFFSAFFISHDRSSSSKFWKKVKNNYKISEN